MLRSIAIEEVARRGMDAYAVLRCPADHFARVAGWSFDESWDELDRFTGVAFEEPGGGAVGLIQYVGQPAGTVTVVCSTDLGFEARGSLLAEVLSAGQLDARAVQWKKAPPELEQRRFETPADQPRPASIIRAKRSNR